jgi:N-acetylglucosamine-6-sulfatase
MSEQSIRDRAEMMLSVDEGLGHILAELEEAREIDNTLIMFTSDNGFFGEHGSVWNAAYHTKTRSHAV